MHSRWDIVCPAGSNRLIVRHVVILYWKRCCFTISLVVDYQPSVRPLRYIWSGHLPPTYDFRSFSLSTISPISCAPPMPSNTQCLWINVLGAWTFSFPWHPRRPFSRPIFFWLTTTGTWTSRSILGSRSSIPVYRAFYFEKTANHVGFSGRFVGNSGPGVRDIVYSNLWINKPFASKKRKEPLEIFP